MSLEQLISDQLKSSSELLKSTGQTVKPVSPQIDAARQLAERDYLANIKRQIQQLNAATKSGNQSSQLNQMQSEQNGNFLQQTSVQGGNEYAYKKNHRHVKL